MLKTIVASLALLCVSSAFAAPRYQAIPQGTDEVVIVPGTEGNGGSVVENKKPDGDNMRGGCGCPKGDKGKK